MTQAPDPLREALAAKLAEMELHDATGDPRDEGYMAAWREFRDALAAVPAESEAWEWRACADDKLGAAEPEDWMPANSLAHAMARCNEFEAEPPYGHEWVERRRPGTAPGEWERVDPEPREEPCTAHIAHGPGHQSKTYCEVRGPHEVHEATYGECEQRARWRDGGYTDLLRVKGIEFNPESYPENMAMTGFHDEPPPEPRPQDGGER